MCRAAEFGVRSLRALFQAVVIINHKATCYQLLPRPIMPVRSIVARTARTLSAAQVARSSAESCHSQRLWSQAQRRHATTNSSRYQVSQERLMNDIHHTSQWGMGERWGDGEHETGMSRLSLSDDDKKARDWFTETTKSLGCKVTVDEMGNQFAVRPGKSEGHPTFAGSHLDTQPTGGRYDGVLGVTAAIEMLRVLNDNSIETRYPVGAVNWTNEEGARFPKSMIASGVWAGDIPLEQAHNLKSVHKGDSGATMLSELQRIGYKGDLPCSHEAMPMAAHFELHIEQGPALEAYEQKIGLVEGVQAYRWATIEVAGREAHTGTTALALRSDALTMASAMITALRPAAHRHGGLATAGIVEARPGSVNTIPGYARFSLDVRAPTDAARDAICADLRKRFELVASPPTGMRARMPYPLDSAVWWRWTEDFASPAAVFHPRAVACVRAAAAEALGGAAGLARLARPMTSGAGHDSVYTNRRCPTAMVFVPSRGGVSHNPREHTDPADCALGAQVLTNAVLRFDAERDA